MEWILANLPFGIRLITVIYYARLIAYHTLNPVTSGKWADMAADAWHLDIRNDPKLLEHPSAQACLIVLLAGSAVCGIVAAIICTGREFHVKVPEKA